MNANKADTQKVTTPETLYSTEATRPVFLVQTNEDVRFWRPKADTNNVALNQQSQRIALSKITNTGNAISGMRRSKCLIDLKSNKQNKPHAITSGMRRPSTNQHIADTGTIEIDSQKIDLEGSYAVQFYNSTVIIDNQKYSVTGKNRPVTGEPLPAILQSNIPSNKEEEILSLEMKKELHVDNTKRLAALETTHTAALIKNFSLTIISIIFIAALIIKLIMKINFKAKRKLSSYNMNANKADTQKIALSKITNTGNAKSGMRRSKYLIDLKSNKQNKPHAITSGMRRPSTNQHIADTGRIRV
ncbi:unnamed protein product [Ceratitis capitata]|uniref:(Mediterranean fruit fly) hypothetical protein n=1 Tax=Ceratitis capitata TaxID=7213 RepID=A0A811USF5_CERCA|nr:unnamed protein product [Ceratitis capitata]